MTTISHDKMTHLENNCVNMNELMDKIYEHNELSGVICKQSSKLSGKGSKAKFEKHQSVLKPSMNIKIFIQR